MSVRPPTHFFTRSSLVRYRQTCAGGLLMSIVAEFIPAPLRKPASHSPRTASTTTATIPIRILRNHFIRASSVEQPCEHAVPLLPECVHLRLGDAVGREPHLHVVLRAGALDRQPVERAVQAAYGQAEAPRRKNKLH